MAGLSDVRVGVRSDCEATIEKSDKLPVVSRLRLKGIVALFLMVIVVAVSVGVTLYFHNSVPEVDIPLDFVIANSSDISNFTWEEEDGSDFEGDLELSYEQIAALYGSIVADEYFKSTNSNVTSNSSSRNLEAGDGIPQRWPCSCFGRRYLVPYAFGHYNADENSKDAQYERFIREVKSVFNDINRVHDVFTFFDYHKAHKERSSLKRRDRLLYNYINEHRIRRLRFAYKNRKGKLTCSSSTIGYQPNSVNHIALGKCGLDEESGRVDQYGSHIHEVFHALGFLHEHKRPTAQDKYVGVDVEKLEGYLNDKYGSNSQLKAAKRSQYLPDVDIDHMAQGGTQEQSGSPSYYSKMPYDYRSVMHYSRNFLTARPERVQHPGTWTIGTLLGRLWRPGSPLIMKQRKEITGADILKLRNYYPEDGCANDNRRLLQGETCEDVQCFEDHHCLEIADELPFCPSGSFECESPGTTEAKCECNPPPPPLTSVPVAQPSSTPPQPPPPPPPSDNPTPEPTESESSPEPTYSPSPEPTYSPTPQTESPTPPPSTPPTPFPVEPICQYTLHDRSSPEEIPDCKTCPEGQRAIGLGAYGACEGTYTCNWACEYCPDGAIYYYPRWRDWVAATFDKERCYCGLSCVYKP